MYYLHFAHPTLRMAGYRVWQIGDRRQPIQQVISYHAWCGRWVSSLTNQQERVLQVEFLTRGQARALLREMINNELQ